MEGPDSVSQIINRIHRDLDLLAKCKGIPTGASRKQDRANTPAKDKEVTPGLRILQKMFLKSGKPRSNPSVLDVEKYLDLCRKYKKSEMKERVETLDRFWAWRWLWRQPEPMQWCSDLPTLLNQFDKYVQRAYSWLEEKGDAPSIKKKLPRLPEPDWDWKDLGIYSSSPWNCIPVEYQHKIMERKPQL